MNSRTPPLLEDATEEVAALIATLHATGRRLEELTSGEVDTVADHDGHTFVLGRAQERLRHIEAAKQAAILNALPAHIALLDTQGVIVSVNEAWRQFGAAAAVQCPGHEIGVDYLGICSSADAEDSAEAHRVAEGIRSVLEGRAKSFSIEYSCQSATDLRWYLMTANPLAAEQPNGAVVMQLDITRRRLTQAALAQSEDGLHRAQVMAKLAHVITGPDGSFERWSETLPQLVGVEPAELPRTTRAWLKLLHPEDQRRFRAMAIEASVEKQRKELEYRLQRCDGEWIHIHQMIEPLNTVGTGGLRWFNTLQDISEQKRAEIRIKRLNRVYAVLSQINTLIVRVQSHEELFRESSRIAVEDGEFRMAWIGVVDKAAGSVKPMASAGEVRDFFATAPLAITETKEGSHGLVGRAIRGLKPVISNDVHADPQRLMKRELAERGINSVAVLPLIVAGEAIGVLCLYSTEVGFFDEEEMRLLQELAGDISFAVDHIEREKQRKLAEIRITRLNRVYAVLSGINTLIVRVRDRDELFRAACRIAVEQGKFKMAWIGLVDRSAMQLKPMAWDGNARDYVERMPLGLNEADGATFGLAGRAVCGKRAIVVQDMETDPRVLLRGEAAARGFHSLVMLPLVVSDTAVGVLALYASEIAFFDESEMKLILELAGDIAFAIDHIDKLERLDYLAYYDSLTGLANRALFLERVAQYTRDAAREGAQLALFVVDLERFKSINDSLGRPAGDALLKQVADWLTRNLGDANLLARVGPDHFAVVLPKVDPRRNVIGLVEKTAAAFMDHPFRLNDAVFRVAFKIGAALYPQDGGDADTLFKNAEAALKQAKASGERYLFYKATMTEAVAGKLTLENQLRQALDRGEFVLHYQPKVSLASGTLTSAEALIRWNDPRSGLVPPGRFIPVLEETGLIHDVGRWALKKAMQDHLRWRAAGLPAVRIAVNVSPLQLRHRDFIAEIRQVVGIGPQAAAGLELEITEGVIMEDIKHNIASLQAIRALGVTIAIDDFGTGFSSLSYLSKLPVDTLKIDRSFVIDMTVDAQGLALVSTIIALAHSLKLKVVAEGVETEEQSRLLRLLRCDEMQGYLFSKPVPAEIFEAKFLAVPALA